MQQFINKWKFKLVSFLPHVGTIDAQFIDQLSGLETRDLPLSHKVVVCERRTNAFHHNVGATLVVFPMLFQKRLHIYSVDIMTYIHKRGGLKRKEGVR